MNGRRGKILAVASLSVLVILLTIQAVNGSFLARPTERVPSTSLTAFFNVPTMMPSSTPPARGEAPPEFTLMGLDGHSHSLKDYRGKAVILNFWASWCAPCRVEMPLLQTTWERLSNKLVVLGINTGEDEKTITGFMNELNLTFPVLLDQENLVARRYSVFGLPTTYFVDANGILKDRSLGPLTPTDLKMYLEGVNVTEDP